MFNNFEQVLHIADVHGVGLEIALPVGEELVFRLPQGLIEAYIGFKLVAHHIFISLSSVATSFVFPLAHIPSLL